MRQLLSIYEQRYMHSLATQDTEKIISQNPDASLGRAGGNQPSISHLEQFPTNDVLGTQAAPLVVMRSRYISKPHSFTGTPGTPLTMQKPGGSVPVA
ncbi:hypothetical protein Dimus_001276 [Dionaea muscipula]